MEKVEEAKKDNYLVRLFKGDIRLVVTYWVFGVLIGGVFARAGLAIIEANYSTLVMGEGGTLLVQALYWSIIGYSAFILIAIWRSAGKYTGRSAWSILARGAVIVNVFSFAANFWLANDTNYALNEEVRMMNKSLPTMVDNDTRLDHVSIRDSNIYYNYTLVNFLAAEINVERFDTVMQSTLKTTSCEKSDAKSILEEGHSLFYLYNDKENNLISKVTVTLNDCL